MAINSMVIKAGVQVAITQTTAPFLPKNRLPINIEMFTARIPGDICAMLRYSSL